MIIESVQFELLRVLIAAAESKNFYEAARRLGLSQPAVSMKLKLLEDRCPLPVFTLRGKKKILTLYGQELYAVSKQQLGSCAKGIESLNRKYLSAEKLTLRVGCRNEVFDAIAPSLLFEGRIELHPMSSHDAILALQSRKIDIAISYERPDLPEVLSKRVLTSSVHLIVHSKWLHGRHLDLKLASAPEFLTKTPSLIYQSDGHLLRDWLAHLGVLLPELKVAAIAQDWRTIQSLVDKGHGYGIVPSYVETHSGTIQRIELPKDVLSPFVFHATFYRDMKGVPAFRQVIARLKEK